CSSECSRTVGLVVYRIPFVEPVIVDCTTQHRLHMFISFSHETVPDKLLNHSAAKPIPIASILVTVGMHTLIHKTTSRISRIERQSDSCCTRCPYIGNHPVKRMLHLCFGK